MPGKLGMRFASGSIKSRLDMGSPLGVAAQPAHGEGPKIGTKPPISENEVFANGRLCADFRPLSVGGLRCNPQRRTHVQTTFDASTGESHAELARHDRPVRQPENLCPLP